VRHVAAGVDAAPSCSTIRLARDARSPSRAHRVGLQLVLVPRPPRRGAPGLRDCSSGRALAGDSVVTIESRAPRARLRLLHRVGERSLFGSRPRRRSSDGCAAPDQLQWTTERAPRAWPGRRSAGVAAPIRPRLAGRTDRVDAAPSGDGDRLRGRPAVARIEVLHAKCVPASSRPRPPGRAARASRSPARSGRTRSAALRVSPRRRRRRAAARPFASSCSTAAAPPISDLEVGHPKRSSAAASSRSNRRRRDRRGAAACARQARRSRPDDATRWPPRVLGAATPALRKAG